MDYSNIPVLVVEDNDRHFAAIRECLKTIAYLDIARLPKNDTAKLYNYKASFPHSQLAIVDLQLGGRSAAKYEGLEIVDFLHATDRLMYFIIFTEHSRPQQMSRDDAGPHVTYVEKRFSRDGNLNPECLHKLLDVVKAYLAWCPTVVTLPSFDTLRYQQELIDYLSRPNAVPVGKAFLSGAIANSLSLLQDIAVYSLSYARAGQIMSHIGVGVFGSCGRLEMRADSDVELVVFYRNIDGPEARMVAGTVWNRTVAFISKKGFKYEGENLCSRSASGFLEPQHIDTGVPLQKYVPVIAIEALEENLAKHSQLRDRHLQIFTELRATFNPEFVDALKRNLFKKYAGPCTDIVSITDGTYMRDLIHQFEADTAETRIRSWKQVKTLAYRRLNTLSTRVWLITCAADGGRKLRNDSEWSLFLEELASPGLVKLIRARRTCVNTFKQRPSHPLVRALDATIGDYQYLLEKLFEHGEEVRSSKDDASAPIPNNLATRFRKIFELYDDILGQAAKVSEFGTALRIGSWLTERGNLKHFAANIEGG